MLIEEVKKQGKPYGLFFDQVTERLHHHGAPRLAGLHGGPAGGLPRLSRRAPGRTDSRRGHRGHAAGEFRQDHGDLRQEGSVQRHLRRRIGRRAGVGDLAGDCWFPRSKIQRKERSQDRPPYLARPRRRSRNDPAFRGVISLIVGGRPRLRCVSGASIAYADDDVICAPCGMNWSARASCAWWAAAATICRTSSAIRSTTPTVFEVGRQLGALVTTGRNRFRVPNIEVRVGSYDFDNTGHIYSGLYSGSRYDTELAARR